MIEFENRMAVEGQREQEELYSLPDEEFFIDDDHYDVTTYCDIFKCSECPRMGDDCDGEDRMAYYEREGDDIVYYDENDCEIYREPA